MAKSWEAISSDTDWLPVNIKTSIGEIKQQWFIPRSTEGLQNVDDSHFSSIHTIPTIQDVEVSTQACLSFFWDTGLSEVFYFPLKISR